MNFNQVTMDAELDFGIKFYEDSYRDGKPVAYSIGRHTDTVKKVQMMKQREGRKWRGSARDENGRLVVAQGQLAYVADWCVSSALGEVREDLWKGKLEIVRK